MNIKCLTQDFPGGAVDKNPPANAGTQVRSLVWEDSTVAEQRSLDTTAAEARVPQQEKPRR